MHTLNPLKIRRTVYQIGLPSDDSLAARIACYNNLIPSTASVDINGGEI